MNLVNQFRKINLPCNLRLKFQLNDDKLTLLLVYGNPFLSAL